jgi:hypothetical protein
LKQRLDEFIQEEVIPVEEEFAEHLKQFNGNHRWTMQALPPSLSKLPVGGVFPFAVPKGLAIPLISVISACLSL